MCFVLTHVALQVRASGVRMISNEIVLTCLAPQLLFWFCFWLQICFVPTHVALQVRASGVRMISNEPFLTRLAPQVSGIGNTLMSYQVVLTHVVPQVCVVDRTWCAFKWRCSDICFGWNMQLRSGRCAPLHCEALRLKLWERSWQELEKCFHPNCLCAIVQVELGWFQMKSS